MKTNLLPALRLTLVCAVFFCVLYTLSVRAVALMAPGHGDGVIVNGGGKAYHIHVAQSFTSDAYFWPRPSATQYNAAGSAGSNKGPSDPDYLALVQQRIDSFRAHNPGIRVKDIPAELVTASGSGIDPDISVAAARVQIRRVAAARHLSEAVVLKLVEANTERPFLGFFGPEKINILKLNLALNKSTLK